MLHLKAKLVQYPLVSLVDCCDLYKRDTTYQSGVDELASSLVGMGFYTTCASADDYTEADKAKAAFEDDKISEEEIQKIVAESRSLLQQ